MKKIAKILMMLAFLFCAVSCNSIDKFEFDISQETKGSDQRENIARVIASMNIDNTFDSYVFACEELEWTLGLVVYSSI